MNCEDVKVHTCCFLGHRKIKKNDLLKNTIYNTIENLIINEKVDTFLFGSKSQFDDLCHKVVTELRAKYSHIKRVYVRAEFPYIDDEYKEYLLQSYESTYYPEKLLNAGKATYVERNYDMIDKSKFCIVYYDENYAPPRRRNSKGDLFEYQPKSGTKLAYEYANQKNKTVRNLFK